MSNISYKDFVNDLSNILISYLQPLKLQFVFGGQELSSKEVFMKAGTMAMFLYDKQSFIDQQLLNKKIAVINADAFAQIHSEAMNDSYFGFKIEIVHNLVNNDLYRVDTSIYENLLYCLAYKILNEKDFTVKGKTIYLDEKYNEFINNYSQIILEKSSKVPEINGDKV